MNVSICYVLMTSRSNFLKLQLNHNFLAEKHTQPTEHLGVPLVISPGHHPKACIWGQLFTVVPGGSAFQQGLLRNAWCDCEHKLVPCQRADSGKHVHVLEKKRPMRRCMSAWRTLSCFLGETLAMPTDNCSISATGQGWQGTQRGVAFPCSAGSWQSLPVQPWGRTWGQWETLGVPLSW